MAFNGAKGHLWRFISEATVRRHLGGIFGKLEVTDRLELLVYAIEHGIVTRPHRD